MDSLNNKDDFTFDDSSFGEDIVGMDFDDIDLDDINGDLDKEDTFIEDDIIEDDIIEDDIIEDSENYEVIHDKNDFISDTGDIVVMDTNENGDNFKLIYVDIESIAIVRRIRKNNNVEDLVRSIKSTGLLNPVTVAPTATDGLYVLLDGYRRILACARAGKRRIPCVVNTKVNTPEIPVLEALYNHNRSYNIKEMVDYIAYLEKEKGIMSASMIEYLLQMNNGDYTKLKDILNDDDEDIVEKLFSGIYTIETAFKKLEQRRKKESAEEKELQKASKVYDDAEESGADNIAGSGEEANEETSLSDDEIKALAINPESIDDGLEETSLEEMVEEGKSIDGFEDHKQDPKNRERLDPTIRKAVLVRDENTCQICKIISGQEYTEVLDIHHIVEVYLGGKDNVDNLVTSCTVCHKLIHLYARGELHMRPFEEMGEDEHEKFKRIVKLGNVIRKGMEAKGMKREQLKKVDNADTIGRRLKGSSDQVAG